MKNIDFLPSRYHEQNAKRNNTVWRGIVCLLFGMAIVTAGIYQSSLCRMIQKDLKLLEPEKVLAQVKREQFASLQKQLETAEAQAALYVYLDHFWPKTQILSELTGPLPLSITMTEVRFAQEPLQTAGSQQSLRFDPKRKKEEEKRIAMLPPSLRDLTRVRQVYDQNMLVIYIDGHSSNSAALHLYVARLSISPLFTSANLNSLEVIDNKQHNGISEFNIRVVVRPELDLPLESEKNKANLAVIKKQNTKG